MTDTSYFSSSAPCVPTEMEVDVKCHSDAAAVVSWSATRGAANFSLTAIIGGEHRTLCVTEQNTCNVSGVNCGETYSLSLSASDAQCSVAAPTHVNLTTREFNSVCLKVFPRFSVTTLPSPLIKTLPGRSLSSTARGCRPQMRLALSTDVVGGER